MNGKTILGIIVVILVIARIGMRVSRLNKSNSRSEKMETMFDQSPQENIQISEFIDTTPKISKITGWYLNENTGKWVGKPNKTVSAETDEETSLNWLRIATFEYKTRLYYALLYETNDSPYSQDKSTDEPYTSTSYIILNTNQYTELVNSVNQPADSATVIRYQKQRQIFSYDAYNERDVVNTRLLVSISSSMNNTFPSADEVRELMTETGKKNLVVKTEKVKGKKMVKFSLSGPKNLDKSYFEFPKSEFKKLIIE